MGNPTDIAAPVLYVVIPCYNEEEVLPIIAEQLRRKLQDLVSRDRIGAQSRVLFCDDGSTDGTWKLICAMHDAPEHGGMFLGISLAHNSGHQNALFAGLMQALSCGCDISVSMDADMQDDPAAIDLMLDEAADGADIVFGVRKSRDKDTLFKRASARAFYRVMRALGAEVVFDSADFRLMNRRALEALSSYGEVNLFLRGIVASMGFRTARVYYRRDARAAGQSKYPLRKMAGFALDGITSFSVTPLRMVAGAGFLFVLVAFAASIYALISVVMGSTVSGWTSLLISIWLVGGSLMVSMGIVGEYVGKIYLETKHRPRYIVAERLL
jgi:glycosyltransferase involved in cell wall biosynthesis